MVDAALSYAARGWPVFPLHGITDAGRCTCGGTGCTSPGKHPRTVDGFKSATVDGDRIRRWWTDYPDSNIGLVTGQASGLVVVDCDSATATQAWEDAHQPWTVQSSTGKGAHYFYRHPGLPIPNRAAFLPGTDLRGDGGYVVAPPSRHATGRRYEWELAPDGCDLETFPATLAETAAVQPPRPPLADPIMEGGRNATMTRHIGVLFAAGHAEADVLTLALALNADKCDPPLPEAEVRRIVGNIARREFAKRPELGIVAHEALAAAVTADALAEMEIDFRQFPGWFSPALTQLVGPALPGTLTIVGARPGCGKTSLLTNAARWLAEQGHGVLYAGMEMPPSMLLRSLAAQALGFNQDAVLLNEWHALPPGARGQIADWLAAFQRTLGQRLVFLPDQQLSVPRLREWMRAGAASGHRILMVDHLHEMDWGEPEQVTGNMARGVRDLMALAKELGVTLYAAAQLKRGHHDTLEDYLVPPQSAIKQCGAFEEVATVILMLHRTLRPDATPGDMERARRGQLRVHDIAEDGTISVHCAKHRLRPGARDQGTRLYVAKGRLFDTKDQRDAHLWGDR